jgi:hypothetical protein
MHDSNSTSLAKESSTVTAAVSSKKAQLHEEREKCRESGSTCPIRLVERVKEMGDGVELSLEEMSSQAITKVGPGFVAPSHQGGGRGLRGTSRSRSQLQDTPRLRALIRGELVGMHQCGEQEVLEVSS